MSEEIWDIYPYNDLYKVSTNGIVKNRETNRELKPRKIKGGGKHGGLRYGLLIRINGKVRNKTIAQMVLETFVGPKPEGKVCCHYNDEPLDNRLENLRWDTKRANWLDWKRNAASKQK